MASIAADISIIGQARNVTTSTTARRNGTALPAGRYILTVNGGVVHVRQGGSAVTATTDDQRLEDNSAWQFTVPATGSAFSYLSLLAAAGTPAVRISGTDEQTAATQPTTWS